jgi:hypothetical protein
VGRVLNFDELRDLLPPRGSRNGDPERDYRTTAWSAPMARDVDLLRLRAGGADRPPKVALSCAGCHGRAGLAFTSWAHSAGTAADRPDRIGAYDG